MLYSLLYTKKTKQIKTKFQQKTKSCHIGLKQDECAERAAIKPPICFPGHCDANKAKPFAN